MPSYFQILYNMRIFNQVCSAWSDQRHANITTPGVEEENSFMWRRGTSKAGGVPVKGFSNDLTSYNKSDHNNKKLNLSSLVRVSSTQKQFLLAPVQHLVAERRSCCCYSTRIYTPSPLRTNLLTNLPA